MDREECLDWLYRLRSKIYVYMPKEWIIPMNNALDIAIKALEQTRWIPVSEKLPEVGSEVLVCYDFKGKRSVYIANFYGDGEFHGFDDEYLTSEGRKYRKAIAWMPLPQPYKRKKARCKMQIVIDIPEETYNLVKSWNYPTDMAHKMLFELVTNGIPLPKGHGRLIDADKTISKICGGSCGCHLEECGYDEPCFSVARIESAPTIIEADNGESDG